MFGRLRIHRAAEIIGAGGVVAHPSEGVYGLACDPTNHDAILRILDLKKRFADKGFILIASQWPQLAPWCAPPGQTATRRMQATWPGPVTWLLDPMPGVHRLITGDHDTIAVRITDHPLCRALCDASGQALLSTSANRSGLPAPRTALAVRIQLGNDIDMILSGALGKRTAPTPIRDARSNRIVRGG